jgi:hypothetical protein
MPVVGFFLVSLCFLLSNNLSNVLLTWDVTPLSPAETYQHSEEYITYIFGYNKVQRHHLELTEFKRAHNPTEQSFLAIKESFKQLVSRN